MGLFLINDYSFSQLILTVEISEIRNNTGEIMLQLFDGNQKVITQEMGTIHDKKCSFVIKNLTPGKYAVSYFHDENLNGEMESNMLGKPTEGYGFSNNVTEIFGPPPFEKWLFELKGDKKIILKPAY